MLDRDWVRKHFHIEEETVLAGVAWEGERLPLEPKEARVLAHLLTHGFINITDITPGTLKSKQVCISKLRAKLRDVGCPIGIENYRGRRDGTGVYRLNTATLGGRLAENGGKDGNFHSASPCLDRVQDTGRGTFR